ncbi:MAG: DUF748 domain-containing protein [Bacteroidales bacterium]|jgi:hypothetical protein
MKFANTRIKKIFLIVTGSLLIAIMAVILLLSPIEKSLAEKYVLKYLGRQIEMSWIYINPFTGYVHISNLKIHESRNLPEFKIKDTIFFSANGVSATFAILKLLSKTIEISEITLDQPKGIIIQNKNEVNFRDLIKLFTPKKYRSKRASFHFNIQKITIKNGEFSYLEKLTPFRYFIKNVNFESEGKLWNADTLSVKFSFLSGPATGNAKGIFTINFKNLDYHFETFIDKYDLKFLQQYLTVLVNYGKFRSNLDANITASGNFKDLENLIAKGLLEFNDFHIGKTQVEDYASFDKLIIQIIELSPKNHQYRFDSLSLCHPCFKYERYDSLDNLQRMFGKNGNNVSAFNAAPGRFNLILTIGKYIKGLAQNFFQSDYAINHLEITKGDFIFHDFAISEKFSIAIKPLYFLADSVGKNQKQVTAYLKSAIQPYGNISVSLSINPKQNGDFTMQYHIQRVAASVFNPYLITYTSFPLDRGTIEFNGTWNLKNGILQSVNHLVIIDPRVTRRLRNKDTKWLPMPLIMSLIRDRGNVIDYEIPITGNLKNPKFHLHDVIMDLLTNIFVKPATTPYRFEVKNQETVIEKFLTLKWKFRQTSLLSSQEKFVTSIVDFLRNNPDASIAVYPLLYAEKEKEHICFFEAKKRYFMLLKAGNDQLFSKNDSLDIDKMSVKDSLFIRFLNTKGGGNQMFTIQEKCDKFIGSAIITARFNQLNKERENAFMLQFREKNVDNRVKIYPGEESIPYNGFSFFKIVYKGEFPYALIKAYRKMNELNDEAPREKFKKERKQTKSALSEISP